MNPTHRSRDFLTSMRYDLPASLVVFLVALPLCLGVALASGAPLSSGLISGIVGGIVVGALSKSPLSVSGPSASLPIIVFAALQQVNFDAFLLAVCLAGMMQLVFSVARAGVIGDFIPSSVITGMLAAIGIILISKQLPHATGYDGDFFGDESFLQGDGKNTLTELLSITDHILPGACIIAALSLGFLWWWDKKQPTLQSALRYVPGPLIVALFGVGANAFFLQFKPEWALHAAHLVAVPVTHSLPTFLQQFHTPDFSLIAQPAIWGVALTIALVASLESLLSIEAVDKLDPFKRVTPTNPRINGARGREYRVGVDWWVAGHIGDCAELGERHCGRAHQNRDDRAWGMAIGRSDRYSHAAKLHSFFRAGGGVDQCRV